MLYPADLIQCCALAAGLLAVAGGAFFRKTYAVVRNAVLAPAMGFFLVLAASSADAAPAMFGRLASLARALAGGPPPSGLGAPSPLPGLLFPLAAALSAVLLGAAVYFPLRSAFLLRIHSMVVTAFAATAAVFAVLASLGVRFGWLPPLSAFLALAVVLAALEKFDFDMALILETSVAGAFLILSPLRARYHLGTAVHLLCAVLFAAVFVIVDLMVVKRRNASKP